MKPIAVTPVNINADLGEGSGNDAAIMPFLHSCSIACGGHFGTARTMQQTVRLAKSKGVLVGAHPSF
ncbi:MAG: LamB/YcsF family protein, partial [Marinirhabdus sp.]